MKPLLKKFIGVLIFIGAIAAFIFMGQFLKTLSPDVPCEKTVTMVGVAFAHDVSEATITFTDEGVFPKCSNIHPGQRIIWVNESRNTIEVSSDPHPIHTDNSEISDGKFVLKIKPKKSASIVMTKKGTFGFHDHIRPSLTGKIIVK